MQENDKGYIHINEKLRIRVTDDSLIVEEVIGKDKNTNESKWGNLKYYSSWEGVFGYVIRKYTKDAIIDKGNCTLTEARDTIITAINEVKKLFISNLNDCFDSANEEIKNNINKFNRF